ncbi:50S ribosomal protein L1 [Candidatus Berkelbacteria bacterium CG08_land_8_20_14_0_20_39_8]|uniref:Large ribosomal subunit protein uL1 n=1 Tax=Candidatus Berkelbacteria bacterium CG08_land_8_20_14_0_20_39_8 TaxID=1974511 RepID=A0A2M6YCF0_9BACT|nr:MAG: 50S ribosomal protein L1 [Candidatus Berkelbacteria bacterium CG08_land_8_20_14_0_20_39_8]
MNQRVKEMVSEEVIDENQVKKQVEKAKKELKDEIAEEKSESEEKSASKKNNSGKGKKPSRSKKYQVARALIEPNKLYLTGEGIEKILQVASTKFDSTIEIHAKLTIDGIRGTLVLPAGAAKVKKVEVADEKTIDDLLAKIKANKFDFDLLIATPTVMPKLAAAAKILGPKGLMPSPKSGTVVDDTKVAIEEIKSGKVEYKQDGQKNIHLPLAKASWGKEKIAENLAAFLKILPKNKVVALYLTSTMSPSVKLELPK